jgi:hypothetical protein
VRPHGKLRTPIMLVGDSRVEFVKLVQMQCTAVNCSDGMSVSNWKITAVRQRIEVIDF